MTPFDAVEQREAFFVSNLALIEGVIGFVSRRHHLDAAEADDFEAHVKLKLVQDNYAVLQRFEGRCSLRGFLAVVVERLLLDYRTARWGKWRPSADAKRLGPTAVLFEQLTVRDGHSFEEAYEIMTTNHVVTATYRDLEQLAGQLPQRSRRRFESDEALINVAKTSPNDDYLRERETKVASRRVAAALLAAIGRLETQDRLILTCRFEDGCTVAEIAQMLTLDAKGLYRRVERLLKRLRSDLEAQGLGRADVIELLDRADGTIDWPVSPLRELSEGRPSITKEAQ